MTKVQFIKQADRICSKTDEAQLEAIARVENDTTKKSPAEREAAIAIAGLQLVQEEAEQISALGAPSGDEEQVAVIVKGIEEGVVKAEQNPAKAEAAFAEVGELAEGFGMKDCSEPL